MYPSPHTLTRANQQQFLELNSNLINRDGKVIGINLAVLRDFGGGDRRVVSQLISMDKELVRRAHEWFDAEGARWG
jgi:hypothetical protein